MKVILNLDEQTVKEMQDYAKEKNITINEVIETLFIKQIKEPAEVINQLYEHVGDVREIDCFREVLTSYMNETIEDIKMTIGTEEEYEDDVAIVHVFTRLNQEHLNNAAVLTDLFRVYWNEVQKKKGRP